MASSPLQSEQKPPYFRPISFVQAFARKLCLLKPFLTLLPCLSPPETTYQRANPYVLDTFRLTRVLLAAHVAPKFGTLERGGDLAYSSHSPLCSLCLPLKCMDTRLCLILLLVVLATTAHSAAVDERFSPSSTSDFGIGSGLHGSLSRQLERAPSDFSASKASHFRGPSKSGIEGITGEDSFDQRSTGAYGPSFEFGASKLQFIIIKKHIAQFY